MKTTEAVTNASGIWFSFGAVLLLYSGLGVAAVMTLRSMSRRWREGEAEVPSPYSPPKGPTGPTGPIEEATA
jgi:cytochrome d ubiquinol oxidase subunit I